MNGTHQCDFLNFCGGPGPQQKYFSGLKDGRDQRGKSIYFKLIDVSIAHDIKVSLLLEEARKLTSSREILLWMTPSEAPKALQASECSELLDPMRASCWIFAQH